jgi:hypothetical protein
MGELGPCRGPLHRLRATVAAGWRAVVPSAVGKLYGSEFIPGRQRSWFDDLNCSATNIDQFGSDAQARETYGQGILDASYHTGRTPACWRSTPKPQRRCSFRSGALSRSWHAGLAWWRYRSTLRRHQFPALNRPSPPTRAWRIKPSSASCDSVKRGADHPRRGVGLFRCRSRRL